MYRQHVPEPVGRLKRNRKHGKRFPPSCTSRSAIATGINGLSERRRSDSVLRHRAIPVADPLGSRIRSCNRRSRSQPRRREQAAPVFASTTSPRLSCCWRPTAKTYSQIAAPYPALSPEERKEGGRGLALRPQFELIRSSALDPAQFRPPPNDAMYARNLNGDRGKP